MVLPVTGDRSVRRAGGPSFQRDARHGGGDGVLPIGQSGHRRDPGAGDHGWARQLPSRHPDSAGWRRDGYLNNRVEQDHHGIKSRYGPMRGFGHAASTDRCCWGQDEVRNFLHLSTRHHQKTPTSSRRRRFLRRGLIALRVMTRPDPNRRKSTHSVVGANSDGTNGPSSRCLVPGIADLRHVGG